MDIGKVTQDIMREVEGLFAATADPDDVRVATEGVRRVLLAVPEQGALTDEQHFNERIEKLRIRRPMSEQWDEQGFRDEDGVWHERLAPAPEPVSAFGAMVDAHIPQSVPPEGCSIIRNEVLADLYNIKKLFKLLRDRM